MPVTLADYALVSLTEFKTYLKLDVGDVMYDDQIATILNGVSGHMERVTSRIFKARTATNQIQRYMSPRRVFLKWFPVITMTSLVLSDIAHASDAYTVDEETGQIELASGSFPSGLGKIRATYEAGYDPLLGDDIAACLDLAKSVYDEWQNGAISLNSLSIGPASISIRPGINPRIEQYLDARRNVRG